MKIIDIWGKIVPESMSYDWSDVSSNRLKEELDWARGEDVKIRFQTFGGVVVEGMAMSALIKQYEGKTTTVLMGISGSIGTMPFLAGEERIVYPTSQFFIHEATGVRAEDLEKINLQMATEYARVSDKDVEFFLDAMKKETTYYGQEIVDMGFATKLEEHLSAVAFLDFNNPQKKGSRAMMTPEEKQALADAQANAKKLAEANQELKTKNENLEQFKENSEQEKKAFAQQFVQQENERRKSILEAAATGQEALAEKLFEEGKTLAEAKAAFFDDLKENPQRSESAPQGSFATAIQREAPDPSLNNDGTKFTPETAAQAWNKMPPGESKSNFYNEHKLLIDKVGK